MKTYSHPAAQVHPYTIRLFIDVDPAGNPIGRGGVVFERGVEKATLWFDMPDPFDSLSDAWADLVVMYVDFIGTLEVMF